MRKTAMQIAVEQAIVSACNAREVIVLPHWLVYEPDFDNDKITIGINSSWRRVTRTESLKSLFGSTLTRHRVLQAIIEDWVHPTALLSKFDTRYRLAQAKQVHERAKNPLSRGQPKSWLLPELTREAFDKAMSA